MMMEALFAQASQGQTFLLMCGCGLLLGGLIQLTGLMRQRWAWLGALGEGLGAAALGGAMLAVLCLSGEGLRLYGLLGLTLGVLTYRAGLGPVMHALGHSFHILGKNLRRTAGKHRLTGELSRNKEGA